MQSEIHEQKELHEQMEQMDLYELHDHKGQRDYYKQAHIEQHLIEMEVLEQQQTPTYIMYDDM